MHVELNLILLNNDEYDSLHLILFSFDFSSIFIA